MREYNEERALSITEEGKRIIIQIKRAFALNSLLEFFENDAHNIISKRGYIKLKELNKESKDNE